MHTKHSTKSCSLICLAAIGRLVAVCLLLLSHSVAADIAGPAEMLTAMTEQTQARFRANPGLLDDAQQTRKLADELILPNIDFRTSSQWVLGKYWRGASASQRDAFVDEFREMLINTYLNSLGKYQHYTVRVLSARPGQPDGRAVVDAEVDQPQGPPVKVMFRLHRKQNSWLVYDIVIEGISLVATHRSGFATEIRAKGLDSLIAHLVFLNSSGATAGGVPAQESP